MNEPTTPGELARLRKVAEDQTDTNHKLLTGMAILMERSERSENWQKGTDVWRANHDTENKVMFAKDDARMTSLEEKYKGVSSGINALITGNTYTLRQVAGGFIILCGAIGGLTTFIAWAIGHAASGKP